MNLKRLVTLFLATTGIACASVVFQLNPSNSPLPGTPGGTTGWGFSLTSDSQYWATVIGSYTDSESNPGLGIYTDLIGSQGGPLNGLLAPGAPTWTQTFDFANATGAGFYQVDPFAPLGATNSGNLVLLVEYYSDDPTTCGNCFVSSNKLQDAFTVQASAQAPEPANLALTGLVLLLTAIGLRRRRRAN